MVVEVVTKNSRECVEMEDIGRYYCICCESTFYAHITSEGVKGIMPRYCPLCGTESVIED